MVLCMLDLCSFSLIDQMLYPLCLHKCRFFYTQMEIIFFLVFEKQPFPHYIITAVFRLPFQLKSQSSDCTQPGGLVLIPEWSWRV